MSRRNNSLFLLSARFLFFVLFSELSFAAAPIPAPSTFGSGNNPPEVGSNTISKHFRSYTSKHTGMSAVNGARAPRATSDQSQETPIECLLRGIPTFFCFQAQITAMQDRRKSSDVGDWRWEIDTSCESTPVLRADVCISLSRKLESAIPLKRAATVTKNGGSLSSTSIETQLRPLTRWHRNSLVPIVNNTTFERHHCNVN